MANPTRPDTSDQPRKGDSRFLPVVIAAVCALFVILACIVFIVHQRGRKILPKRPDPHPSSMLQSPRSSPPLSLTGRG